LIPTAGARINDLIITGPVVTIVYSDMTVTKFLSEAAVETIFKGELKKVEID
jgi:hypothetical protein